MRNAALLLLLLTTPAPAHDLAQHEDLPYLAADCAGYWQAVAAAQGSAEAAARAASFRAAAKELNPALSTDIDYVAETSTTRARQMLKDAAEIAGAARLLREQEASCAAIGAVLPAKWGLR
ncbi:hypothetical protein [Vannielia litorea]|uniref:hypothetical protein n=1 Tax=Vannielia litorea TaxID=1217970 RepID=UPI001BCF3686|nr:hypothetical protein [Vannielia litorea]MBS8227575.1 hypothetical protein [Vannielia litorea]